MSRKLLTLGCLGFEIRRYIFRQSLECDDTYGGLSLYIYVFGFLTLILPLYRIYRRILSALGPDYRNHFSYNLLCNPSPSQSIFFYTIPGLLRSIFLFGERIGDEELAELV